MDELGSFNIQRKSTRRLRMVDVSVCLCLWRVACVVAHEKIVVGDYILLPWW